MSFDAHKNFAYSTVATAPSPASSGTTLIVQSGDGANFPAAPFNATVWPAGTQPSTSNAEIVRVTAKSTDTFTITRTQESTSARAISSGDQIAATITAKSLTDIESAATGAPLAVAQYAPGTLSTYTISATTLTAVDTTNLTVSFTVPASGNVIVRFSGSIEGSGSSTLAFALLNHSGGAQVGKTISNVTNSSSPQYSVLEWYLTGLSAGSLGLDLAAAMGAGGGSGKVWAQGFTGSSGLNGDLGPAVFTVIAA